MLSKDDIKKVGEIVKKVVDDTVTPKFVVVKNDLTEAMRLQKEELEKSMDVRFEENTDMIMKTMDDRFEEQSAAMGEKFDDMAGMITAVHGDVKLTLKILDYGARLDVHEKILVDVASEIGKPDIARGLKPYLGPRKN